MAAHREVIVETIAPEIEGDDADRTILGRFKRAWPTIRPVAIFAAFTVALWLLYHEFKALSPRDIAASFRAIPLSAVIASIFFTAMNYVVLVGYDWLGSKMVEHSLTPKQIAVTSFLSYSFSNSFGVVLGGTPARVRLYSAWGMSVPNIVRLVFFISLAFWIGLFTLSGVLFVVSPFEIPDKFHLPLSTSRPLGAVLLVVAGTFFGACAFRRRAVHFFGINFLPPRLPMAMMQATVASLDFIFAAAAMYVLLPAQIDVGFPSFLSMFLFAIIVALISHVPGGLGVFELVFVAMMPKSSGSLAASMLAFRIIYYVLPLLLAVAGISVVSARRHKERLAGVALVGVRWTRIISPRLITGAVFVAGVYLLVSAAIPAAQGRLEFLSELLPLSVVEISHFLSSVIGAVLLILAYSLQRRIDAAWSLAIVLLGVGSLASLLKGFDYEDAAIQFLLLLALLPCRRHFYRRGHLLSPSTDVAWIGAIIMATTLIAWMFLFSYRHVEINEETWWRFTYRGEAPRSLRALFGACVIIGLVGIAHLLRPRRLPPQPPSADDWSVVERIVAESPSASANLALLGDKHFVFSGDRKAFVMFGFEGKSWITMGDPVGPEESADDAAWKFREACDAQGVWPVFYQVSEESLGRYVEMGMRMIKIGEEARVPLTDFSLEGRSRKDLRRAFKRGTEGGLKFEYIERSKVPQWLPQLKAISDAWLAEKNAGEKGFSLGFFDEEYLRRCDLALLFHEQQPVAFCNLWLSAERQELSMDLMRYTTTAPSGVMDFLFVQLMIWGHEQGYKYFSLGMAPLSGVHAHRLGPVWNRVSNLMYLHGEHFYNFQGLRQFKNKFDPEWSSKYVAYPKNRALPHILTNVSTLISGGLLKLLRR